MCVTSKPAELSSSFPGILVNVPNGTHTLLYQNKVKNLGSTPNCMILPILGEIVPDGLIDTTNYGKFMEEIVRNLTETRGGSRSVSNSDAKGITVQKVGKYDVLVAVSAETNDIIAALSQVDENKRPVISADLIDWYKEFYKNPQLVICCFDNAEEEKAQPLMVEFIPRDFNKVLLPGADSHDGSVPRMGKVVDRDHTLVLGMITDSELLPAGMNIVHFTEKVPYKIMNAYWKVVAIPKEETNADWVFDFSEKGFSNMVLASHKEQIPGYSAVSA